VVNELAADSDLELAAGQAIETCGAPLERGKQTQPFSKKSTSWPAGLNSGDLHAHFG
jgi:hypothetical protein